MERFGLLFSVLGILFAFEHISIVFLFPVFSEMLEKNVKIENIWMMWQWDYSGVLNTAVLFFINLNQVK